MGEGYFKDRPMANAGPRGNRRKSRAIKRASIPEGETLVFSLDPLWVKLKPNHECRRGEYVYAIKSEAENCIKFGHTVSPWSRLNNFQVGYPSELGLILLIDCGYDLGKGGVERAVHLALGSSRIRGEWFDGWDPGVRRLTERPESLPWSVIKGMVGLGYKAWLKHSTYPMAYRQSALEGKLESVKRQFDAKEWAKL